MDEKAIRVSMVQPVVMPYRWSYYVAMSCMLADRGIEFQLLTGTEPPDHICLGHSFIHSPIKKTRKLIWQNVLNEIKHSELVIVHQEAKQLVIYPLLLKNLTLTQRVAMWGHGKNFQSARPNSLQERTKQWLTRHSHWFFAYNNLSAQAVANFGYPKERTTNMMNAIDVSHLAEAKSILTPSQLDTTRDDLGIKTDNVGIYTGAMYPDKRMPFLLKACELIRTKVPDFEMIFIGGGEDVALVKAAALAHSWIHYVGYKNNEDKVPYWALAKVFLMPGAVGLVILDSFALETPMVTTAVRTHGPEIDYLEDGINGIMVSNPDSVDDFVQSSTELFLDESKRQKLVEGCRSSAPKYTIEKSAELFSNGIIKALHAPHYRGFGPK